MFAYREKQGRFGVVSTLLLIILLATLGLSVSAQSFNCAKASNEAEKMICADSELKALDVKMATVYNKALAKSSAKDKNKLRSEQVGWIKGRNDCKKRDGAKACINEFYTQRISYLSPIAEPSQKSEPLPKPITFTCRDRAEVVAYFIGQDKVRIEFGDTVLTLPRVQSGSGAKYADKQATFWTKGNEATFDFRNESHNCTKSN